MTIERSDARHWNRRPFAPPAPEIELSATLRDLTICMSREERVGGPLPLRGIYLPGMVFKALPGPSGEPS